MNWLIEFHPDFLEEYRAFSEEVQDNIAAKAAFIGQFGPQLGRPHVDTLKDSAHSNMKELRLDVEDGVWRVAFAFDPERKAIMLVAGDKSGGSQKRFYKTLLKTADNRFSQHIAEITERKRR